MRLLEGYELNTGEQRGGAGEKSIGEAKIRRQRAGP